MKPEFKKVAQQILKEKVDSDLEVDGIFGRESITAAKAFVGEYAKGWSMTPDRWVALVIQQHANATDVVPQDIDVDGWLGPDTVDAGYRLMGGEHVGWRPDEKHAAPAPHEGPRCWTPSDSQMTKYYGQPGTGQITISLPFPMRLDWDLGTTVTKATCHKLAAPKFTSALEALRDIYGAEQLKLLGIDRFGGILNVRKKRGGTSWSAHAWGSAIDLWPSANQLAWKKNRAVFAKPVYAPMRKAFADAGLMSLGTCYDFDWMHWQLNPP